MDYRDLVKPATFANDEYFQALTKYMRANDPVPYIETETLKPFWVCTKQADIAEIERQNQKFLNTQGSVLVSKAIEAEQESGPGLRTLIDMVSRTTRCFVTSPKIGSCRPI